MSSFMMSMLVGMMLMLFGTMPMPQSATMFVLAEVMPMPQSATMSSVTMFVLAEVMPMRQSATMSPVTVNAEPTTVAMPKPYFGMYSIRTLPTSDVI
eukprot:1155210-Pelagomonas_calceolata.AAC.5